MGFDVKGFITALGGIGTGAMFAVWALIELVTRLASVLVVMIIAWAVFAVVRARRRRIRDDERLQELWAQTARVDAARPPAHQQVALPQPYAPHYEPFYLVRGDDTGFAADRDDGYLNVCAPALPSSGLHQLHLPARRRRCRRRPTRRRRRP
ncbi:hypothetical protein [Mycobacterium haemophilum]